MAYRDADGWLEWAQGKYEAAQERFAWMGSPRSDTMDSYSTLVDLIECGMAYKAEFRSKQIGGAEGLRKLADQMETLGKEGSRFSAAAMVEAAQEIRGVLDGRV